MQKGILFIISAPGGAGKGTICKALADKRNDIFISISATSRAPRKDEEEGRAYYFKTVEQFKEMIEKGELLEWVEFCGNYYGTPKNVIDKKLDEGINVLVEIETIGAQRIKKLYPDAVSVFILTPSYDVLVNRLRDRGEDEDRIKTRTTKAIEEVKTAYNYDYIVINDKLDEAVKRMENIIDIEHSRPHKNKDLIDNFFNNK